MLGLFFGVFVLARCSARAYAARSLQGLPPNRLLRLGNLGAARQWFASRVDNTALASPQYPAQAPLDGQPDPALTDDVIAAHGFTPDEFAEVKTILGRDPNYTEMGIFSAMWNEHCSYKSSKKWLRT